MLAERSLPPEAWCGVIGALELGLNTAVAESTGKPAALGAFGELPRLPVDVVVRGSAPALTLAAGNHTSWLGTERTT